MPMSGIGRPLRHPAAWSAARVSHDHASTQTSTCRRANRRAACHPRATWRTTAPRKDLDGHSMLPSRRTHHDVEHHRVRG